MAFINSVRSVNFVRSVRSFSTTDTLISESDRLLYNAILYIKKKINKNIGVRFVFMKLYSAISIKK
ncbi:unnamed protein product [Schistosoma mattheei]|uniref:Uncharacterized protein n=1 Tax=Schistosoma mattheei TaxID=31246 RepID=A0A3P8GW22_9TREM|nr:unnamed protein product [Schistosoma mattheei]